jgi:hypothetical protein
MGLSSKTIGYFYFFCRVAVYHTMAGFTSAVPIRKCKDGNKKKIKRK